MCPLSGWMRRLTPFSALDPMTRRSLQLEVKTLQQKLNKTIIFVTHDMEEALDLADVIIFMNQGEIVQIAPPEEMLENPATDQIREFLGRHQSGPDPASHPPSVPQGRGSRWR